MLSEGSRRPFRSATALFTATAMATLVMIFEPHLTAHAAPIPLGGTWISPRCGGDGQAPCQFGEAIGFEAHATPEGLVDHVNFTANWGNGWQVVCRVAVFDDSTGPICPETTDPGPARRTGDFKAMWYPRYSGVPAGTAVQISFDVVGGPGDEADAPNGIHRGIYGAAN